MDNRNIPPAFKIMRDHQIEAFASAIFGSTVGTFIDHGMTDLEILTVTEEFCKMIRSAAKDPAVLSDLVTGAETMRPHMENPQE